MGISRVAPLVSRVGAWATVGSTAVARATVNLPAGAYAVKFSTPGQTFNVIFFDSSSTRIAGATGTAEVLVELTADATEIMYSLQSAGILAIERLASVTAGSTTFGTPATITATGNYTTTGTMFVCVVGGGGGGSQNVQGLGGGSGGVLVQKITTNATTSVTIGAAGLYGAAGGATSFGALTANGGSFNGVGGTPGGAGSGLVSSPGFTTTLAFATTGGGGGAGSGIGTGGAHATFNVAGGAGSGYGAGGGGVWPARNAGAAGSAGVVYVLPLV